MIGTLARLVGRLRSALERRAFGLSAEEIRYTFEDVRAEIRATRTELLREVGELRAELDRMEGRRDGGDRGDPPAVEA